MKLYASFREKFPSEEVSEHEILVNRDFRKSITPRPERVREFMFVCLQAVSHVGIMDMKVSFYNEKLESIREELRSKNMKATLHPDKIEELEKKIMEKEKGGSTTKLSLPPMPTLPSTERSHSTSHINYLKKNQTEAARFKAISTSKKTINS
jgi:predicted RNase H-like nuclease (RuvC/YqgF family)